MQRMEGRLRKGERLRRALRREGKSEVALMRTGEERASRDSSDALHPIVPIHQGGVLRAYLIVPHLVAPWFFVSTATNNFNLPGVWRSHKSLPPRKAQRYTPNGCRVLSMVIDYGVSWCRAPRDGHLFIACKLPSLGDAMATDTSPNDTLQPQSTS